MKKYLSVLFACMCLVGCKANPNLQENLDAKVNRALAMDVGHTTFNHGYYSYYIQPSIGRLYSDETSNVFVFDNVPFVMNLNVPGIVNRSYESQGMLLDDVMQYDAIVAKNSGEFLDGKKKSHPYTIAIFEKQDVYYTILKTDLLEFYAVSHAFEAPRISEEMLKIARSTVVDEVEVLAAYSKQETIAYNRKTLELFQNITPENGVIDELFNTKTNYAGSSGGQFTSDATFDEEAPSMDDVDLENDEVDLQEEKVDESDDVVEVEIDEVPVEVDEDVEEIE